MSSKNQIPVAPRSQPQHLIKSINASTAHPLEAILNDEIQMKDIKENLHKLQIGSQRHSIRDDLNKNVIFCKESTEAISRMGNVELIELRQTTSTVQCPACWKHIQEWMLQCLCGIWLRPEIKLRFAELVKPYYWVLVIKSRGRRHLHLPWQQAHCECRRDAKKGAWKNCKHESILDRWQNDEQYRARQAEEHGWTFE